VAAVPSGPNWTPLPTISIKKKLLCKNISHLRIAMISGKPSMDQNSTPFLKSWQGEMSVALNLSCRFKQQLTLRELKNSLIHFRLFGILSMNE
jgi:hypothetical protein